MTAIGEGSILLIAGLTALTAVNRPSLKMRFSDTIWHLETSVMAGKKADSDAPNTKTICRNRKASHEYELFEKVEAGLILTGTEVKSLRTGKAQLEDAYAKMDRGELWLMGCEIPEYALGTHNNHKPKRARKLLLHRREIAKFGGRATQEGFTLVPLQLYFKDGKVKVELAVARGKQLHDKRQSLKKSEAQRDIQRALSRRR
jgi:SsrA-binding protein